MKRYRCKEDLCNYCSVLKYVIGLILCIAFLLQAGSVITYAKTYDGFRYQYNEEYGGIEITKYKGKAQKLVIPDEIEGIPVVAIASYACKENKYIKKLIISDNVKYIGDCAFYRCPKLKSAVMPKEISVLGEYVFSSCRKLDSVKLPENLTCLTGFDNTGFKTFHVPKQIKRIEGLYECLKLKTVTFDKDSQLEVIGSEAFFYDDALTDIEIPAGVTEIGDNAFHYCFSLKNVSFPKNSKLKTIGYSAFEACKELEEIKIPKRVTQIQKGAFLRCENLKTVTFRGKCPKLEKEAFNKIHWAATFQVPSKYKKSYEKNMHKFGWYYAIK